MWKKANKNDLETDVVYKFKGVDHTPFTCLGRLVKKKGVKNNGRKYFQIKNKNGEFEPDWKTWADITHYEEL